MFIGDLANSGALPSLEATLRFAGARQRQIAQNIANIDTPDYRQADLSPRAFQQALGKAIDARRAGGSGGGVGGELGRLPFKSDRQIKVDAQGNLSFVPSSSSDHRGGVLFHDRNNRDLEQLMADQAENAAVYRTTIELIRSRTEILRTAISERV